MATDFKCRVCGVECPCAPENGQAVCEQHCEDHAFEYDPWRRGEFCVHCDKEREYEPCDDDVPISFSGGEPKGTPLSEISGRPGHKGYEEFCRIAKSWGYE